MIVLTNLFCGIMIGCMEVLMEICETPNQVFVRKLPQERRM